VNCDLILDVHFVELIDTADTVVSQHQGSCFNAELSCFWVFPHACCKTSRA
jgi:hypothetical protein